MTIAFRTVTLLSLFALPLTGCERRADSGPIEVSVIGPALDASPASADRGPLDAPAAALIGATGQGLVRFDASGQIVPGLAARWIVSDGGRSLIFRLPDLPDRGVDPVDAGAVARRIRTAADPQGRNPLRPLLGAIDEVDAVTPQVIDVELKAPRPNMLQLFAQPALALGGTGHGPFAVVAARAGAWTLRPLPDRDADPDEPPKSPPMVRLAGRSAGRAIARFVAGGASLVLGGRFTDLPVARIAQLPRGALRFDPVKGLFGLAFVRADKGLTADTAMRRALAMAIDRDAIARLLDVPNWTPATAIVGPGTPEIETPATPSWSATPTADRRAQAAAAVAHWAKAHGSPPPLRVAMPTGPGARLLYAAIVADWHAIGIDAVAVGLDDEADLRLVDEVAPADVASFYLRAFACDRQVVCTELTDRLLVGARDADSLAERQVLLTQADALMADTTPFIAFGPPVRWSLVAPDLDLYRDSPRALHPLNELKTPLKR